MNKDTGNIITSKDLEGAKDLLLQMADAPQPDPELLKKKREPGTRLYPCKTCKTPRTRSDLTGVMGYGLVCGNCLRLIKDAQAKGTMKVMVLSEEHSQAARVKLGQLCTKPNCKACYGRGYLGFNEFNLAVICSKCVTPEAAYEWWHQYVLEHEDLRKLFPWEEDDN